MSMSKNKLIVFVAIALIAGVAITFFLKPGGTEQTLPSSQVNEKIALDTTLAFAQAVNAKDLSLFRSQTTKEFKTKFSHKQFEDAFGGFVEQNINLTPVAKLKPVFIHPPFMTEDGTLTLKGYFPTRPSQLEFDYSYLWRNGSWKVTGVSLEINPVNGG